MAPHAEPRFGEWDQGRVWFERSDGELTIGVSLLTAEQIGEIERVSFPGEGDKISKGDLLFAIEGTLATYEWNSPVSATVLEVNAEILDEPGRLNEDPEESGWLVRLETQDETDKENESDFGEEASEEIAE